MHLKTMIGKLEFWNQVLFYFLFQSTSHQRVPRTRIMAICRATVKYISYLLWWILFILIGPLFLFIFGFFFIWKFVVIEPIAKLSISKTIRSLNAFDGILATDSFWENPLATVGLLFQVDGKVELDEFRLHFQKTILEAKTNEGDTIYKKLLTIPRGFGGYFFWEEFKNFQLEDHVREIETKEASSTNSNSHDFMANEDHLHKFYSHQIRQAFPVGKPLWDITLLNFNDSKSSALFFRFHHCIADGYTVVKLVDRLTGIPTTMIPMKNLKVGTFGSRLLEKAKFILQAPSVIAKVYIGNLCHSDLFTNRKTTSKYLLSSTSIPLDQLRQIRQTSSTHFTALAVSLLSGSLRKHLETQFMNPGPSCNEPLTNSKFLRVMLPLPWPNHPNDKMKNHWSMGLVHASYNLNALERLKITESNFCSMLKSGGPSWSRLIGPKLLTLLPASILKRILTSSRIGTGIIFTSVPGSAEKKSILLLGKHEIQNIIPVIGPQYAQTGIVCVLFTYNGKANCTIVANLDVVQNQVNLDRVCHDFLHQEIASLFTYQTADTSNLSERLEQTKLLSRIV